MLIKWMLAVTVFLLALTLWWHEEGVVLEHRGASVETDRWSILARDHGDAHTVWLRPERLLTAGSVHAVPLDAEVSSASLVSENALDVLQYLPAAQQFPVSFSGTGIFGQLFFALMLIVTPSALVSMGRKVDLLRFVAWLIVAWVSFTVFTGPGHFHRTNHLGNRPVFSSLQLRVVTAEELLSGAHSWGATRVAPEAWQAALGRAPQSGERFAVLWQQAGNDSPGAAALRLDFVARPARIPLPVSADPAKASQVDCYALGDTPIAADGFKALSVMRFARMEKDAGVMWNGAPPVPVAPVVSYAANSRGFCVVEAPALANYLWDGCFISSLTRKRQLSSAGSAIELRVAPNAEAACLLDSEALASLAVLSLVSLIVLATVMYWLDVLRGRVHSFRRFSAFIAFPIAAVMLAAWLAHAAPSWKPVDTTWGWLSDWKLAGAVQLAAEQNLNTVYVPVQRPGENPSGVLSPVPAAGTIPVDVRGFFQTRVLPRGVMLMRYEAYPQCPGGVRLDSYFFPKK